MKKDYSVHYSDNEFWVKISNEGRFAGTSVCYNALLLYYILEDKDLTDDEVLEIKSALGYFILEEDTIPDFAPAVGYNDDIDIMLNVINTLTHHVCDNIKEKADKKVHDFFA